MKCGSLAGAARQPIRAAVTLSLLGLVRHMADRTTGSSVAEGHRRSSAVLVTGRRRPGLTARPVTRRGRGVRRLKAQIAAADEWLDGQIDLGIWSYAPRSRPAS
jgi:hypothetical protein